MKIELEEIEDSVIVGLWATAEYIGGCSLILLALWYFWLRPIFE